MSITHLTTSSSTGEDAEFDIPLSLAYSPDTGAAFEPLTAETGIGILLDTHRRSRGRRRTLKNGQANGLKQPLQNALRSLEKGE